MTQSTPLETWSPKLLYFRCFFSMKWARISSERERDIDKRHSHLRAWAAPYINSQWTFAHRRLRSHGPFTQLSRSLLVSSHGGHRVRAKNKLCHMLGSEWAAFENARTEFSVFPLSEAWSYKELSIFMWFSTISRRKHEYFQNKMCYRRTRTAGIEHGMPSGHQTAISKLCVIDLPSQTGDYV